MGTRIEKVMAKRLELKAQLAFCEETIKIQTKLDEIMDLDKVLMAVDSSTLENCKPVRDEWLANYSKKQGARKALLRLFKNATKTFNIKKPAKATGIFGWVDNWNSFCVLHDHWDNTLYYC